jgi:hypothetical protein
MVTNQEQSDKAIQKARQSLDLTIFFARKAIFVYCFAKNKFLAKQ